MGTVVGLPLGVGVHYFGSIPLYGSDSGLAVNVFLLLGVGAALVIGLALWGAVKQSIDPVVAAAAIVVAGVIGSMVGPGGPGSGQTGSGTGSAGTRQHPSAFWSGSVTCEWQKGQDSTVRQVLGFDVRVSDPAVLAALGLDAGAKVVAIALPPSGAGLANLGVGEDRDHFMGMGSQLALEGVTGNGRAGTAVATNAAIVFVWSCTQGP